MSKAIEPVMSNENKNEVSIGTAISTNGYMWSSCSHMIHWNNAAAASAEVADALK